MCGATWAGAKARAAARRRAVQGREDVDTTPLNTVARAAERSIVEIASSRMALLAMTGVSIGCRPPVVSIDVAG
jgi:hypothetical protein